jgi:hypothetical protein
MEYKVDEGYDPVRITPKGIIKKIEKDDMFISYDTTYSIKTIFQKGSSNETTYELLLTMYEYNLSLQYNIIMNKEKITTPILERVMMREDGNYVDNMVMLWRSNYFNERIERDIETNKIIESKNNPYYRMIGHAETNPKVNKNGILEVLSKRGKILITPFLIGEDPPVEMRNIYDSEKNLIFDAKKNKLPTFYELYRDILDNFN